MYLPILSQNLNMASSKPKHVDVFRLYNKVVLD